MHSKDHPQRTRFSFYWQREVTSDSLLYWWNLNLDSVTYKHLPAVNVDLDYFYERMHGMAGKNGKSASYGKDTWKGFVNINLREQDKTSLQGLAPSPDDLLDCIDAVIKTGHKITVTKHAEKPACVVSFTGYEKTSPNCGYTLSSYAGDFFKAFLVNYYKHHYMANGDWKSFAGDDIEDFG